MLRLHETGTFFIPPHLDEIPLVKGGSWYSRANIFHLTTSFRNEKRPLSLYLITKHILVCLRKYSFFKEVFNQTYMKNGSLKAWESIEMDLICTWIHCSKPTKLLKLSLSVRLFKNPSFYTTIYSRHFEQLTKNLFENKFCVAIFQVYRIYRSSHQRCSVSKVFLEIS